MVSSALKRLRLEISGRVQGVGFRPAIYQLAVRLQLAGWVGNGRTGVLVEIEGHSSAVDQFRQQLPAALPVLARVDAIAEQDMPVRQEQGFVIRASEAGGKLTLVPPDLALCPLCRDELFQPANRRYRYPFINCTACGPRYSIAETLPYDRANTVMRHFPMCPDCAQEYGDAEQRRFHHQTITCASCGPQLAFWSARGEVLADGEAALAQAVAQLQAGAILAVKGLGGFHLMVDARQPAAIARLRAFKRRPSKPFAVMFPDVEALRRCCVLSAQEQAALESAVSPLLLLDWNEQGVDALVAPHQQRLGVMLPYTPLHALLLHDFGGPLIATSGNRGGEPLCIDEQLAVDVFDGLVDGLLVHNRPIIRGVDDSIAQWAGGALRVLRRSRGWVPEPLTLAHVLPPLLAVGGHLKTTIALGAGHQVVVSAHIGDLDTGAARDLFAQTAQDMARLLEVTPQQLLHDSHIDYASSQWAQQQGLPLQAVQHHIAHLAGVGLEHGAKLPLAGCIWDGSGLGADGTLWGGETLGLEPGAWHRLAWLLPFPLPGGEAAAREPRRCLLGVLLMLWGEDAWSHALVVERFSQTEIRLLRTALAKKLNCPVTSSVGRLFDAVSSLLGLCQQQSFEGEAAMLLQSLAEAAEPEVELPALAAEQVMDWRPLLLALVDACQRGVDKAALARGFHLTLARNVAAQAIWQRKKTWALGGGCFQNRLLLEYCIKALRDAGVEALIPRDYPAGDGGLALGQLAASLYLSLTGPSVPA